MAIKFKSFPIDDTDGLNKFVDAHPPINTKDGSGVIFRENHILVIYEDGTFNEKAQYRSIIQFAINDAKQNMISKNIAIQSGDAELRRLFPGGRKQYEETKNLTEYFQKSEGNKQGLPFKHAQEMAKLAEEIVNKTWLAEKEHDRMKNIIIPSLETLLLAYGDKK